LGHFNFASAEQLKAIILAFQKVKVEASDKGLALMLGTSQGEAEFLGYGQARALVDAWKAQTGLPLFLNADHHTDIDLTKKAIEAGYDTVLFDGSKLSLEDNIVATKEVTDYMKAKNPQGTIEGELGYLRGASEVQETIEIGPDDFTKPEEASQFVQATGVDRLAVAVGNIHGLTTKQEMKIDFDLLSEIISAVPQTHIVLHGGSGLKSEDFKKAISAGVTNVHINTEIRVAYRQGLDKALGDDPSLTTPYKFLAPAMAGMAKVAEDKLRIFSNL